MKKSKSLFEREMESPSFRKKYKENKKSLRLELQILDALEKKHLTFETFAKRVGTQKSNVSRDLKGKGLWTATIGRVERMAKALDCDFVPLFLPRDKKQRAKMLSAILAAG